MDQLIGLIVVLFLIAVLLFGVVIPIVALVFSVSARKRITALELRLARLEATLTGQPVSVPEPKPAPPPPAAETPPADTPGKSHHHHPRPRPPARRRSVRGNSRAIIGRRWIADRSV